MKPRRKAILTAAAVTALFSAGGCGNNEVQNVYGPPPDDYNYRVESVDVQTAETTESHDTADVFDPADNQNADVYGPPEWFGGAPESEESVETEETEDTDESRLEPDIDIYKPEMNITPCVYGPPEWFATREAEPIDEQED